MGQRTEHAWQVQVARAMPAATQLLGRAHGLETGKDKFSWRACRYTCASAVSVVLQRLWS